LRDLNTTGSEPNPLDQIWQIETEVAARIASARMSAGRSIASDRSLAIKIKNQAREAGLRAGQERYQGIIDQAEQEAEAITNAAQTRADLMRRRGHQLMDEAITQAFCLIVGREEDLEKP